MNNYSVSQLNCEYKSTGDAPSRFIKFPSLKTEEHLSSSVKTNPNVDCCVAEKIHGANFPIIIDIDPEGNIIYIAPCKRSGPITSDTNLFKGCFVPLLEMMDKIKTLVRKIAVLIPGSNRIYLYTELYGRSYPQGKNKIVYTDKPFDIIVFQIKVNDTRMSMQDASNLCDSCGIPHVPWKIMHITQLLAECEQTNTGKLFLLDRYSVLAERNNISDLSRSIVEGYVVQPLDGTQLFKLRGRRFIDVKNNDTENKEPLPKKLETKLDKKIVTRMREKYLDGDSLYNRIKSINSHEGECWASYNDENKTTLLVDDIMKHIMNDPNEDEQFISTLPNGQHIILQNSFRSGIIEYFQRHTTQEVLQ